LPSGQTINNLWNGVLSKDGTVVRVEPASWNTTVETSTTFGFIADAGPKPVRPEVRCTSP
jgi:hypothetical protein